MPSINLAPGTQYIIATRKRRVRLYSIAGVTAIVFVFAWGGLYVYKNSIAKQEADLQMKIQTTDAEIERLHNDAVRVALFEKRLGEVKTLLDTHVNWSRVFADLERLLPADTVLTNFEAASNSPTITMQGVTAQVDQISIAVASLTAGQGSIFTSASVKNIQRQEQKNGDQVSVVYSFTMTLMFDPKILWQ